MQHEKRQKQCQILYKMLANLYSPTYKVPLRKVNASINLHNSRQKGPDEYSILYLYLALKADKPQLIYVGLKEE